MDIIDGEENYHYAGFWIRFIAYIIDGLVLYFSFSILVFLFTGDFFYQSRIRPFELNSDYWSLISANTILAIMYYAALESSKIQATLGKMLMGIKVVDLDGGRITPLRAIGRYLGKIVSGFILLIGYIMAAFDSRKQALHDKMAGTFVVYDRK